MKNNAKATGMWVIYIITMIIFIYGFILYMEAMDSYRVSESKVEFAWTVIGYSIAIDLWSLAAYFIFLAGAGKGYFEAKYFWLVFLFPIVGAIVIAVLPDLVLRNEIASIKKSLGIDAPRTQPFVSNGTQAAPAYSAPSAPVYNSPSAPVYNAPTAPNYNTQTVPIYSTPQTNNQNEQYQPQSNTSDAGNNENTVKMCAKYALSFTTDLGMVRYVRKIAKEPEVGEAFIPLLELDASDMYQRLEELAR